MTAKFFDRAYRTTEPADVENLYDDWAQSYDADVVQNGYVTPARCAAALAHVLPDRDTPIYDFACGTGLSGAALAELGFSTIDGADLSDEMLAAARNRGIYRTLIKAQPGAPVEIAPGRYGAIAAIGALSPGAAPAPYLKMLMASLAPGGLLVFSYNDHTLADPAYTMLLQELLDTGIAAERFCETGDHIVKLGSKSVVYVLERTDAPMP